ncbi:MAG: indolepyruvate oxidoreductase subunit beta [Dehalococcoidales bacterium]|nr:indolepyruvate oxidoreductase subunit beta [Dehalococcoidales bacterium]
MKDLNLIIAGVGGQGNILASNIMAEVALTSGYDTKQTDTLGMAQRGGSVISQIRASSKVYSPLIKLGQADLILAFEKLEALRWAQYLNKYSTVIINNHRITPTSVNIGKENYPEDKEIISILKEKASRVIFINGNEYAINLGNIRVLNIFMLGCASFFLPFKVQIWENVISQQLPSKIVPINITAFNKGRKEIQNVNF